MQTAAVVILNYNGREVLERFLPSVINFSTFPVIVADNCSTDTSVDFLKANFPSIELIILSKNHGFAGGYNIALQKLKDKFEYFILLNSDVEVTSKWDITLISWLKDHPEAVSVQPKILSSQNPSHFDYAGAGGGFLDQLGYPFCRGRILEIVEEDHGQYNDVIPVDWTSGACLAVRASDFFDFGGFDGAFFAHMEEIDLCWRWRNAGKQPYFNGEVTVFHYGGGTLSRSNSTKVYLNFRNSLLMNRKNLEGLSFYKVYLFRMILDFIAMFLFFTKGRLGFVKAVIKAHLDYKRMKKNLIKIAPSGNEPEKNRPFSILWHYYGLGKRKFHNALVE